MSNLDNINIQDLEDDYASEKEFYDKFKERLASVQSFPGEYTFKFIVPSKGDGVDKLKEIFGTDATLSTRESANGTYTSVTIKKKVNDAAGVVYYYKQTAVIEKIMML